MEVKDNNVRIPIGCALVSAVLILAGFVAALAYCLVRLHYHG